MPKVALVYPYYRTRSSTEMLFPPLGSALLKGQLNARGVESRIFDGTFSTPRALLESLRSYAPDIIGIYSMISLSRAAFAVADAARALFPASILVAGGPLPTLYPGRFSRTFDAVFRGEADVAFPAFCADASSRGIARTRLSELPLNSYEGLFLSRGDLRVDNPSRFHSEKEIDGFPLPDRSDFDHAAYQAAWQKADGSRTSSLMTTYGCPYGCDFCSKPVFGNVYRKRTFDRVFREVDELRDLGYDTLWIGDDSFTLSISRVREFCRSMEGRGMRWSCLSRVNGMDPDTAVMMREAGCRRVYLGMESGSPATLQLMNKRATVEDGLNAANLYRDAGIEVAAFLMVGYPGETIESIESTFRLSLSLPLDYISFNVPFPLPGSPLFERVSGLDTTKDWNAENEVTFVFKSEFDQRWIQRRIRQTMREFARARRR
jgi:anaerobic magnesium-protoporphyrin IX monomethyl ester cyclase